MPARNVRLVIVIRVLLSLKRPNLILPFIVFLLCLKRFNPIGLMLKQYIFGQGRQHRYHLQADAPVLPEVIRVHNHVIDFTRPPDLIDRGLLRSSVLTPNPFKGLGF
jgi:hypothetical protein